LSSSLGAGRGLSRRARPAGRLQYSAAMNRWRRIGILGGIVAALGWAALLMPWVLRLEETAGLEALFSLRGPLPAPAEVAVVTIDRDAATALGQSPRLDRWSRTLHAELIEQLRSLDVAAIAF